MTVLCPCCNRPMEAERAPIEALASAPLTRSELKIVEALGRLYPQAAAAENLLVGLHTDLASLKVQICRLRKKIAPYGWAIPPNDGGARRNGFYRLAPIVHMEVDA